MSAILDRKIAPRHTFVPDVEDTDQYEFNPIRVEAEATAELDRLRPLLAEYDPHDHVTEFYNPRPEYGVILAKFIGYSLLAAVPLAIGASIIGSLSIGC
ncbi:MAG: hypothetical protein ACXW32_07820 [Limisphaerales bacterium]